MKKAITLFLKVIFLLVSICILYTTIFNSFFINKKDDCNELSHSFKNNKLRDSIGLPKFIENEYSFEKKKKNSSFNYYNNSSLSRVTYYCFSNLEQDIINLNNESYIEANYYFNNKRLAFYLTDKKGTRFITHQEAFKLITKDSLVKKLFDRSFYGLPLD